MNLTYTKWNKELEVYYGILKNDVELIEEVNKLKWVSINDNFFDIGGDSISAINMQEKVILGI